MTRDPQIDQWNPRYFTQIGAPDEVEKAFQTILGYLSEVEKLCNYKCDAPLHKVFQAINSLPRDQKQSTNKWSNRRFSEKMARVRKEKHDRIKGFEIGQLVKFAPHARHHEEQDGKFVWGIDHVIARVTRRNQHTISAIEISRRGRNQDAENPAHSGLRWRISPQQDTIINE